MLPTTNSNAAHCQPPSVIVVSANVLAMPTRGAGDEQPLAAGGVVAVGAEDRRGDGDDGHADRGHQAEAGRRLVGRHPAGRVAGEEGGEDRGDDGGEVGGVAAVVPRPRTLLGGDQANAGEQTGEHRAQG